MKFIVDSQIPESIVLKLQEKGYDAIHVSYLRQGNETTDSEIKKISVKEKRVLVSKDEDFIESLILKREPYKLLFINPNINNQRLMEMIDRHMEYLVNALESNRFFEIS